MIPSLEQVSHERQESFAGLWLARLERSNTRPASTSIPVASAGGRRLQLELEAGAAAPAVASGDGLGIVFEGRLYNGARLRDEIGDGRAPLDDAEVVLRAFERWGPVAIERLKGIFSFCLWDSRRGRLWAARDRVGVFPLFYSQQGEILYFSTSTEAFGKLPGPGLVVDRAVIAGLIARQSPQLEETFYQGIRRVPPGSILEADESGVRVDRYWRPAPVGAGAEWVREDELGAFGELLEQAVARALDEGPAGIYLSGGLDSVSVAAAAVERAQNMGSATPQALSLLFPGQVNEEGVQRGVADVLGIDQTFLELEEAVGSQGLVDASLALSAESPAPLQNVWLPAYQRLGREGKERGCRVILSGGGGDEWLTVTPLLAADLIRSLDVPGLARYIGALQRSLDLPHLPLLRNVLWTNGIRPLARSSRERLLAAVAPGARRERVERALAEKLAGRPEWLAPDASLRRVLDERTEARFRERLERPAGPGPGGYYFDEMYRSLEHPLFAIDIEEIFESSKRMGMMQYDIYWDADLIEFLYRVPPHLLNSGGRSKGLVRKDAARRFPGLGFDRQKKLLSRDYFCSTLLEQGGAAWKALGGVPALADLGLVEPQQLEGHVREVLASGDQLRVDDLWRILSLESWVRPRV